MLGMELRMHMQWVASQLLQGRAGQVALVISSKFRHIFSTLRATARLHTYKTSSFRPSFLKIHPIPLDQKIKYMKTTMMKKLTLLLVLICTTFHASYSVITDGTVCMLAKILFIYFSYMHAWLNTSYMFNYHSSVHIGYVLHFSTN